MRLLTHGRIRAARTCLRLAHFAHVLGRRPRAEAAPLRFGTLFHRGREAFFRSLVAGRDLETALDDGLLVVADVATDDFECATAAELLRGYAYRWESQGWQILAVEVEFRAPLVHPDTGYTSPAWTIAGKIDAIISDANGRILVDELKTSSEDLSPGSTYWQRGRMRSEEHTS